MMLVTAALGALGGCGVLMVCRSMRPAPLAAALNRLAQARGVGGASGAGQPIRRALAPVLNAVAGRLGEQRLRDLAVVEQDAFAHATRKIVTPLIGMGVMVAVGVLSTATGFGIGGPAAALFVPLAGALGYVMPDRRLASAARRRRTDVLAALSAYLDLVNVLLAGGAGLETALHAAADAGDGWTFEQLRAVLLRSRTTRTSVWTCFAELGRRIGVDELVELGAAVQLAGQQGARIAQSLSTRAQTLRAHVLEGIEIDAQSASERMGLPTVLLFVGFLFLLGYPAVQIILASS
ncbi:MAG: type II secretion system F family protein [Actinomycetota bacterium]